MTEPNDPMAGLGPAAWMGLVYEECGEDGLRELLEQLSDPTPEFFDELVNALNETTEYDRKRMWEDILPGVVQQFAQHALELESLGLTRAADVINQHVAKTNR